MRPKTYVLMILDKSGSMESCRTQTIQSFNEKLQHYKEETKEQDILLSFYTFNGHVYEHLVNANPTDISELTWEDYVPDGSTAMLDAMGHAISVLKEATAKEATDADQDVAFFVELFSDGYENASQKYSRAAIAEIIDGCQKTGKWTFAYVGSDQDLSYVKKLTQDLNIPAGNVGVMCYAASSAPLGFSETRSANQAFLKARRSRTDEQGAQIRGQAVSANVYNVDNEVKNLAGSAEEPDQTILAGGTLNVPADYFSVEPAASWTVSSTSTDASSNTGSTTSTSAPIYQVPHRQPGTEGLPGKRIVLKK